MLMAPDYIHRSPLCFAIEKTIFIVIEWNIIFYDTFFVQRIIKIPALFTVQRSSSFSQAMRDFTRLCHATFISIQRHSSGFVASPSLHCQKATWARNGILFRFLSVWKWLLREVEEVVRNQLMLVKNHLIMSCLLVMITKSRCLLVVRHPNLMMWVLRGKSSFGTPKSWKLSSNIKNFTGNHLFKLRRLRNLNKQTSQSDQKFS